MKYLFRAIKHFFGAMVCRELWRHKYKYTELVCSRCGVLNPEIKIVVACDPAGKDYSATVTVAFMPNGTMRVMEVTPWATK